MSVRSITVSRLLNVGILPTQQRTQIADILFEEAQHLSAEQIRERLRERGCSVSKATVYNTLRLFSEVGILREVFVDSAKVFYDTNIKPHHHFYDATNAELIDIPHVEIKPESLPRLPDEHEIKAIDVTIRIGKK